MAANYAGVAGAYKHHTASAVLVEISENDDRWIPRSVIDLEDVDLDDMSAGQMIELQVAEWWAAREGLV